MDRLTIHKIKLKRKGGRERGGDVDKSEKRRKTEEDEIEKGARAVAVEQLQ